MKKGAKLLIYDLLIIAVFLGLYLSGRGLIVSSVYSIAGGLLGIGAGMVNTMKLQYIKKCGNEKTAELERIQAYTARAHRLMYLAAAPLIFGIIGLLLTAFKVS